MLILTIIFYLRMQTYDGMIIGEHSRETDLDVMKYICSYYNNPKIVHCYNNFLLDNLDLTG